MYDEFGDRMKFYESSVTSAKLTNELPIYARIDGRAFSSFTSSYKKPFDTRILYSMQDTMTNLVNETGATLGYVQSDEISLGWVFELNDRGQLPEVMFGGKIHKLTSVLASLTTAEFICSLIPRSMGDINNIYKAPHFDCRVMNMPSEVELSNMFLWRTMDAKRNAIQSIARSLYSHKELQGKSQEQLRQMISDKNVKLELYPEEFLFGSFYFKGASSCYYPDALNKVRNRTDFLFHGQEPIYDV